MIYLDSAGGTRPYKEVIDVVSDVLSNHWGNPGASYSLGDDARNIINEATQIVAKDINCDEDELIWTSSASESNAMAIMGVLNAHPYMNFVTTKLEHSSITRAMVHIKNHSIYFLQNDRNGLINLNELNKELKDIHNRHGANLLVSISGANSEIGVIQDIKTIADIVHEYGGILHTDCSQLYPEKPIDVKENHIDLMTLSGQKIHAGHGCGVLYVNKNIKINPIIYGTQQNGLRGSTLATHLIAAFGKAVCVTRAKAGLSEIKDNRDYLLDRLLKIEGVHLNGPGVDDSRLVNNISITVDGVDADTLMTLCDMQGVVINKGSVCNSYNPQPSKVLKAIGLTNRQALSTIRITLSHDNTFEEIQQAAAIIENTIRQIRETQGA